MKKGVASRFVSGFWPQGGPHKRGYLGSSLEIGLTFQLILSAFFVFFMSVFFVQYYSQHFLPIAEGTQFMGEDISGLYLDEVEKKVEEILSQHELPQVYLEVNYGNDEQVVLPLSLPEVGVTYDLPATVEQIVEPQNSYMASVVDGGGAVHGSAYFPELHFDAEFVSVVFDKISSFERPVRQARIDFDDEWFLSPSRAGVRFSESSQQQLYRSLMNLQRKLDQEVIRLTVELDTIQPQQNDDDLKEMFVELQKFLHRSVEWEIDGKSYVLRLSENPDMIRVNLKREDVSLDTGKLQLYVQGFARSFDRQRGQVLIDSPVEQEKGYLRSSYTGSFTPGRSIDQDLMFEQLLTALESEDSTQKIEILWSEQNPVLEMAGHGELTRLSQGRSSYVLSHSEERTFNVKKGLGKYDGVVIPQGEEFSFNKILGYVRYEDGWKPALAIFGGGGVTPVPGGGLCQVSTTTYRAAIHAGLSITQRKPHSLDVSYYRAYGDGIDSTIYPPADIDLKFINDTPGPLFIHAYTDDVAKEAFVEFYGVDDGRSVELKQLVNRPVNLEHEVVYTDDLPQGITEETKPRQGRYVEWEWKIVHGDGEEEYRKIETLYPARRRTVRVGTGPAQLTYN